MSDQVNPNTQLTKIGSVGVPVGMLPEWWIQQFGNVPFVTTIDPEASQEAIDRLLTHLNGNSYSIKDYINLELNIVHFTIKPPDGLDDDGAEKIYPVVMMDDGKGCLVRSTSRGIVRSLYYLHTLHRQAPWDPPIRVRIRSRDIGDGKQWYLLELLDPLLETKRRRQS